jgi:sugar transferase (PEP-CTERM system associated)
MLRYLVLRKFRIIFAETTFVAGIVLLACFLPLQSARLTLPETFQMIPKALLIALTFQLFLHLRDVHDSPKACSTSAFAMRLGQALLMGSVALWTFYFYFPSVEVGRGLFVVSLVLSASFLVGWHIMLRSYFMSRRAHSNVLVLGTGKLACELVREILRRPELGLGVKGFVDDKPELVGVSIVNPCVLGLYQDLPFLVSKHQVDRIVVELQDRRGRLPVEELLQFKTRGIVIEDATTFYERITGKVAIENLKPSWMIFNEGFQLSRPKLVQKQIIAVVLSSLFLLLFSPLFLLIMLLVKLDSRGPIFLCQKRVGQGNRVFTLWKFRSMWLDAENGTGAVWAEKNDPRVTRVGRILRQLRLDEIPQLLNVIRGDMTLVGPRPERPEFVSQLENSIPYYALRHTVKPGVTGWAQINYGYANSIEHAIEKLQYELFYIKNMSWLLDAIILFETVKTVLLRRGI